MTSPVNNTTKISEGTNNNPNLSKISSKTDHDLKLSSEVKSSRVFKEKASKSSDEKPKFKVKNTNVPNSNELRKSTNARLLTEFSKQTKKPITNLIPTKDLRSLTSKKETAIEKGIPVTDETSSYGRDSYSKFVHISPLSTKALNSSNAVEYVTKIILDNDALIDATTNMLKVISGTNIDIISDAFIIIYKSLKHKKRQFVCEVLAQLLGYKREKDDAKKEDCRKLVANFSKNICAKKEDFEQLLKAIYERYKNSSSLYKIVNSLSKIESDDNRKQENSLAFSLIERILHSSGHIGIDVLAICLNQDSFESKIDALYKMYDDVKNQPKKKQAFFDVLSILVGFDHPDKLYRNLVAELSKKINSLGTRGDSEQLVDAIHKRYLENNVYPEIINDLTGIDLSSEKDGNTLFREFALSSSLTKCFISSQFNLSTLQEFMKAEMKNAKTYSNDSKAFKEFIKKFLDIFYKVPLTPKCIKFVKQKIAVIQNRFSNIDKNQLIADTLFLRGINLEFIKTEYISQGQDEMNFRKNIIAVLQKIANRDSFNESHALNGLNDLLKETEIRHIEFIAPITKN